MVLEGDQRERRLPVLTEPELERVEEAGLVGSGGGRTKRRLGEGVCHDVRVDLGRILKVLGVDQLTPDVKLGLVHDFAPITLKSGIRAVHWGEVHIRKHVTLALEADRRETVGRRGVLNHLTLNHTGEVRVTLVG